MFEINNSSSDSPRIKLKHPAVLILLFGFIFVFGASIYHNVFAKSQETISKLLFSYAGELYNIKTTQKDVLGALREAGINIYDQDEFSIPKNTILSGQSLEFSITQSWPVVIYDNEKKILGRTSSTNPDTILNQNGLTLYPEDKVTYELILNPVQEESAGPLIRISRAPKYNIYVDETEKVVRSWGGKISDVIAGQVELGPRDLVEPSMDSYAVPQDIVITRINIVETEENASIPFSTSYQDDYYTNKGTNTTIIAGKNGSKKQLYRVTYKNGKQVSKVLLSETTVENPVKQVIKRGLKPTNDKYNRWPVLVTAGTKYGVSPSDLYSVMMCESKGYQYSGQGGPYQGIFQWDGSFYSWAEKAGYAGADIFDVNAQAFATALRVSKQGWVAWGCKP